MFTDDIVDIPQPVGEYAIRRCGNNFEYCKGNCKNCNIYKSFSNSCHPILIDKPSIYREINCNIHRSVV